MLKAKIDEGAFGEVFRAEFREMTVAVKRIKMTAAEEIDANNMVDFQVLFVLCAVLVTLPLSKRL